MNIVVTGSKGFIGQRLVARLKEDDNNIILEYDRKDGHEAREALDVIKRGCIDVVYHLAAQTSVFNDNIEAIRRDNIDLFIDIALACQNTNTRLVYASSSTANECNTTSMYGLSKKFNEDFARMYAPIATGVRFHNVWSETPREGTLMWHLLNDKSVPLYNNGKNIRCYTWVEDAVTAIIKAKDIKEPLLNIVNNEPLTTKEFADIVNKYYKVHYYTTTTSRKRDNLIQSINNSLPLIDIKYHTVDDVFNIITNNK